MRLPKIDEGEVTLSLAEYRRLQRMATAARHAFDVLNQGEGATEEQLDTAAWEIWRAMEGMSVVIHFPTDRSEAFAFRRRAFSSPARAGTVDLRWG